ncbi:myelin regulatory factor-like [Paramacrobiotus metropolitanus]|uniref:myelin regulatory factor-like n=1 Tax=Paramacrobiotus metropolitanus TaxID=2943436 RepID=UPI00244580FF|nr:myelin regulatory factor-like [Paramacrobiotus metropolitanus]
MDQTMPNFNLSYDGSYSNTYNDYFPSFTEHDYDMPVLPNYPPNDVNYPGLSNGHCVLPDSPPDSHPDSYAIPNQFGLLQNVHRVTSGYIPHHGDVSSSTGPSTSGVIPIPAKPQISLPHQGLPHVPPFPYPKKRLKGSLNVDVSSTSYSSASNSPLSIHSCKQEDDRDLDFPMSNSHTGNLLYYQPLQSSAPSDDMIFGASDLGDESQHRNITFKPIFTEQWCNVAVRNDRVLVPASIMEFKVQADKGFNYSQYDFGAFICQKKNHFQVTVQVVLSALPQFVKLPTGDDYEQIKSFFIDLCGVRAENIHQHPIKIEESQSDRSRKSFIPRTIDLSHLRQQMTIARLHFSETTLNNQRKKLKKPNPEQKFFRLVVGLYAVVDLPDGQQGKRLIHAVGSENIIVRASNPQQFEHDGTPTPQWQKAPHDDEAIFYTGSIGINNDRPEEALDIRGNMRLSGRLIQPSDARAKEILEEVDPKDQLKNIGRLRIVRYKYKDEVARVLNLQEEAQYDTGILAQDVLETIPEAVEDIGDLVLENGETVENFLMVNKDRLFMENLGAVKELYNLTDSFGSRIVELERMYRRVAHLKSRDSFRSNISAVTTKSVQSSIFTSVSNRLPTSVSARPSIYSVAPPPGVFTDKLQKKPSTSEPASLIRLGKSYMQWLTLGLVTLVSICLIALLALYITSKPGNDTSEDQIFTAALQFGSTTATASSAPVISTRQPIIIPGSDQEPFFPQVIDVNWDDATVLWSTGLCKFVTPVANDEKCVLNVTYAEKYCKRSPFMETDDCCVAISANQFIPPNFINNPISINGHGYGYGRHPAPMQLPEYKTDQNDLPTKGMDKNLQISFVTETDSAHSGVDDIIKHYPNKLFGKELDDGNAVLYRADIKPKQEKDSRNVKSGVTDLSGKNDKYIPSGEPCPDISEHQTENWDMVEHIDLVEPDIRLTRAYCNTRKEPCGTNHNYLLTVPLSKYYADQNITVRFTRKVDTVLMTCAHYIEGGSCFRNQNRPGFVCRSDEAEEWITVPIANYLRSELKIRVAEKRTAAHFNKNLCEIEGSKDIVYYNIVFVRSCR